jgi:microcystin-dependent protein
MDGVPTQTAGTSELLASDWNTYVRDNFDAIKFGHIVCTDSTRPTGIAEGTMIYETNTNKVLVYSGNAWIEINDLDNTGGVSDGALTLGPVGSITAYAGASAPSGWLLCDGSAVSQTTYAALYAVLGSTYDVTSPGAGNFRVPDLRGRSIFGKDDMGGSAQNRITYGNSSITGTTLGAAGGDERLHGHAHTQWTLYTTGSSGNASGFTNDGTVPRSTPNQYGINYGGGDTGTTGSGSSQNMPPAIILNYIIKT